LLCLRKGIGKGVSVAPCVRSRKLWIISYSIVFFVSLFGAALNNYGAWTRPLYQ
jgi:hypothetical protein